MIFEAQMADTAPATERQVIRDCVEQAVFAEEMGFDRVWAVEHHCLKWYAHMSAPEIFLTWVAARTSRIRIGHGVVCMPFNYNHPIRVAERAAMLDILSGGRLDLGAGRGATLQEMSAMGVDPDRTYVEVEEALRMIGTMWRGDDGEGDTTSSGTADGSRSRRTRSSRDRCRCRTRRCSSRARSTTRSRWRPSTASVRWCSGSPGPTTSPTCVASTTARSRRGRSGGSCRPRSTTTSLRSARPSCSTTATRRSRSARAVSGSSPRRSRTGTAAVRRRRRSSAPATTSPRSPPRATRWSPGCTRPRSR